jgi:hypothetical protein
MKITELSPNERVVWHCIGDVPEWKGTELTWELEQTGEGTVLRFRHAKWKSTGGMFALCNSTWGALMYRLRDWAEGGQPGPLFKGHL